MAESMKPHRGSPPPNDGMAAARVAFPQSPEDFENDERVSYSKLDQKWILEEEDGQEWEFDEGARRWIPLVCSTFFWLVRLAFSNRNLVFKSSRDRIVKYQASMKWFKLHLETGLI